MSDNSESNEIVNEFLVESYEGLDQLDLDLVELEQCGGNAELIGRVFRCVHTIKGTCGFLGFGKLESVAHVGENLLSKVRDGSIGVSPDLTSALLRLNDALRGMLGNLSANVALPLAELAEAGLRSTDEPPPAVDLQPLDKLVAELAVAIRAHLALTPETGPPP